MIPEIKLVVSQNDTILQSVTKEVDSKNFVKTLENFQEIANATLTKMIDDHGGSGKHLPILCILFFTYLP